METEHLQHMPHWEEMLMDYITNTCVSCTHVVICKVDFMMAIAFLGFSKCLGLWHFHYRQWGGHMLFVYASQTVFINVSFFLYYDLVKPYTCVFFTWYDIGKYAEMLTCNLAKIGITNDSNDLATRWLAYTSHSGQHNPCLHAYCSLEGMVERGVQW